MDSIAGLLREIYKDAYLEGRKDGLEGLHTEPQIVFESYIADEKVSLKLSNLGCTSDLILCESIEG
ncbi:MAG: hypothetical protein CML22_14160 [Rheinheimera sp.]|nr:hypothetical protein [Rheinheimera sp.]MBM35428.1 hypothetical protein [Rheinheimera sp.]